MLCHAHTDRLSLSSVWIPSRVETGSINASCCWGVFETSYLQNSRRAPRGPDTSKTAGPVRWYPHPALKSELVIPPVLAPSSSPRRVPRARAWQALNDVWVMLLCGTEPPGSTSPGAGFLSGLVAGIDAEDASRTLLDRLRRAAGTGRASKATLVKLDGGGVGGGLVEAKPREVLAAMKLFLNKCF